VLVAGQEIDLRIRGGFPKSVDNLSLKLVDADGAEWDIPADAGSIMDWDTGEVLYSCKGIRLDSARYGVIEEDPYNADRWRTIIPHPRHLGTVCSCSRL